MVGDDEDPSGALRVGGMEIDRSERRSGQGRRGEEALTVENGWPMISGTDMVGRSQRRLEEEEEEVKEMDVGEKERRWWPSFEREGEGRGRERRPPACLRMSCLDPLPKCKHDRSPVVQFTLRAQ